MKLTPLTLLLLPLQLLAQDFSGYTEPHRTLELTLPEPGILHSLSVEEGDPIQPGQILAQLNNDLHNVELKIAHTELARLQKRHQNLSKLAQANRASNAELEKAHTELTIQQLQIEKLQAHIERRTLRAHCHATITEVHKHAAEGIHGPNTPILTAVQTNTLNLNIFVDYRLTSNLKIGQTLPVKLENNTHTIPGTLTYISPHIDKASRTTRIKITLDNSQHNLSSGILAHISL